MAQRDQHAGGGQRGEVRHEQKLQRLQEFARHSSIANQPEQQHEQTGHEEPQRALQPAAHTKADNQHGRCQHQRAADDQPHRAGQQAIEHLTTGVTTHTAESAAERGRDVGQCPTGNHQVKTENEKTGQSTEPAGNAPTSTGASLTGQTRHRVIGVLPTTTADHHLGHQQRDADQQNATEIHQHKCAAAVLTGDVGELPDIAQADRRASGGQEEHPA